MASRIYNKIKGEIMKKKILIPILTGVATMTAITPIVSLSSCAASTSPQPQPTPSPTPTPEPDPITEPLQKNIIQNWDGDKSFETKWVGFQLDKLYPEDLTIEMRCLDETFGMFSWQLVKTSDKTFDVKIVSEAKETIVNNRQYRFKMIIRNINKVLVNNSEYTITPKFVNDDLSKLEFSIECEGKYTQRHYMDDYDYNVLCSLHIYNGNSLKDKLQFDSTTIKFVPSKSAVTTDEWDLHIHRFTGAGEKEGHLISCINYDITKRLGWNHPSCTYNVSQTISLKHIYSCNVETRTINMEVQLIYKNN